MRRPLILLCGVLLSLVACDELLAPAGDAGDAGETDADDEHDADVAPDADAGPTRLFSFAILTDLHVGEGRDDYGTPGFDDEDEGEDEEEAIRNDRVAITKINDAAAAYEIDFVMVLGDLTDSGERSEFVRGRELLEELAVPFFPLLGNHDMWPYTRTGFEATAPLGDRYLDAVWADHLAATGALFEGWTRAPGPVSNPEIGAESTFINFAFEHLGYHFIALDLVTRQPAPEELLGVNSEADLHDFDGGTLRWLDEILSGLPLRGEHEVFLFAHHPPLVTLPTFDLTADEVQALDDFIRDGGYDESLWGFFAGHHHTSYETEAYAGQWVVVTEAAKETSVVRIVQVFDDGSVDWSALL